MGSVIVGDIIDRAVVAVMNDKNKVRFKTPRGVQWVNEAQRYIAGVNPSSFSDDVTLTLAAGARQTLPDDAHQIIAPNYNVSSTGALGRAITPVKPDLLDVPNPNWRSMSPATEIRHVVGDNQVPRVFYVYPPAAAGVKINAKLALIPPLVGEADPIVFDDTYEAVIVDYILSRFYQKDAEYAGNKELAGAYFQSAMNRLQMKSQIQAVNQVEAQTERVSA